MQYLCITLFLTHTENIYAEEILHKTIQIQEFFSCFLASNKGNINDPPELPGWLTLQI
jgi:hypothetical protein